MTREDAGGIAGTVVDAATGRPVPEARVAAQCIKLGDRILGGGGGRTTSDAQGHFTVGGLAPGAHNLLFQSSPKGRKFTGPAVEGVRVKAGEKARADLRMVAGRRLHGMAIDAGTGKPLAGLNILMLQRVSPSLGRGLPRDLYRWERPLRILRSAGPGLRLHQYVRKRARAERPRRIHEQHGWARIPSEAVEIDLIFPQ